MINVENQKYPVKPEDLTPEWLTDALREDGCIKRARVTSLTWELVGEGVGFIGQIARVTPAYDENGLVHQRRFSIRMKPGPDVIMRRGS